MTWIKAVVANAETYGPSRGREKTTKVENMVKELSAEILLKAR